MKKGNTMTLFRMRLSFFNKGLYALAVSLYCFVNIGTISYAASEFEHLHALNDNRLRAIESSRESFELGQNIANEAQEIERSINELTRIGTDLDRQLQSQIALCDINYNQSMEIKRECDDKIPRLGRLKVETDDLMMRLRNEIETRNRLSDEFRHGYERNPRNQNLRGLVSQIEEKKTNISRLNSEISSALASASVLRPRVNELAERYKHLEIEGVSERNKEQHLKDQLAENKAVRSRNSELLKAKMQRLSSVLSSGNSHAVSFSKITGEITEKLKDYTEVLGSLIDEMICFPAGTAISTPQGLKKIEDLVEGDEVYACDMSALTCRIQPIEQVFKKEVSSLVEIEMAGESLRLTPNHPVWIVNRGWVPAEDVEVNSKALVQVNRREVRKAFVTRVELIDVETPVNVYNIEVAKDNNYFAGEGRLLVHNCNLNDGLRLVAPAVSTAACAYSVEACGITTSIAGFAFAGGPLGGVLDLAAVGASCGTAALTCRHAAQSATDFLTMAMKGKDGFEDKWSREPKSIQDRMALDAAKRGEGRPLDIALNDPRYKGMEKWEYKIKSAEGKDTVIHYVKDPITRRLMDFKFKKHSTDW